MLAPILEAFGIDSTYSTVTPLDGGLINKTWKVVSGNKVYILQRINDAVFKNPFDIAANIQMIGNYLTEHHPEYLFVLPFKSKKQEELVHDHEHGYFRLFPFIAGSHTLNVVSTPEQAFEAAAQFGKFTHLLSHFDSKQLHITLPDFHNLTLRYQQFEKAITVGNPDRIKKSQLLIREIKNHTFILSVFEKINKNKFVRKRVTHHDTKISNVLFNDSGKSICVIDLDTVMPGYFISDLGDMMRTYLSPVNEEESDFTKIEVRDDFLKAIVQGYLSFMQDDLTKEEHKLISYSGLFLTYMQALRFLTDYCNNDVYYGSSYDDHNFVRAGNQLTLLKRLQEKMAN